MTGPAAAGPAYLGAREVVVVGREIARQRRRQGWTQSDLADKAGISRVTLTRIERGQHAPRMSTLLALLGHLGMRVSVAEMLSPLTRPGR